MASPKAPPAQNVALPLVNLSNVNEVFVTELTGSQVIAGNLHMEFSVVRPAFTSTGPGIASVTLSRVTGARIVMPVSTVADMAEQLRQIIAGLQTHQHGPGPKAN